jgi:hypothetical protein
VEDHRGEVHHQEPQRGACPEEHRGGSALGNPGRAEADATEISGRLAAGPQVSAHRGLFLQARMEMRLRGAVRRELRAVRQERRSELAHAVEHRASDLRLAELRQVLARRTGRQEHLPDAAAEQRRDERHREQQPTEQPQFQRQAQRQQVLERQRESQTRAKELEPTQVRTASAAQQPGARAYFSQQSWQLPR